MWTNNAPSVIPFMYIQSSSAKMNIDLSVNTFTFLEKYGVREDSF